MNIFPCFVLVAVACACLSMVESTSIRNTVSAQRETFIACEGSKVALECEDAGQYIQVISAVYGRNEPGSKICPHESIKTTICSSPHSTRVAEQICNGKNICHLAATNSVFGDPCVGTYKYLKVNFICNYRRF